jgi:hypothetical protein
MLVSYLISETTFTTQVFNVVDGDTSQCSMIVQSVQYIIESSWKEEMEEMQHRVLLIWEGSAASEVLLWTLEDNNLSSDSLSQSSEDTHSLYFWYIRETIKFKVRCWLISVTFLSTKIWFTIGRLIWRWNYSSISGGTGSSQDTLELPQSLVKHLAFHTPWSQNSQWIKTEVMMDRTSHLVDISCFLEWMLTCNWSLLQTVCHKSPKALTISSLLNSHGSCVSLCWEGSTSRMPGRCNTTSSNGIMTVRSRFDTRTSHFLRTTLDWHFGFV